MIIRVLISIIATAAFAALFQAPKKQYFLCGLVGGVAYLVYSLIVPQGSVSTAVFFASLALTVLSRMFSAALKTPVTVFLIPGIFPLVPGAGIYSTAYHLFSGEGGLAAEKGLETLLIAGSISLGLLFGSSIPQKVFDKAVSLIKKAP